jgi:hypothetical protein
VLDGAALAGQGVERAWAPHDPKASLSLQAAVGGAT